MALFNWCKKVDKSGKKADEENQRIFYNFITK